MEHAQRHPTAKGSRFMSCWIGWIVPLVLLIAMPMNARSQTVHALLVIMDADLHLGTAMKANLLKVESLLTTIDEAGKFRVKTETLLSSRNTARKSRITEWLETIQSGDNDVIFVYFSGQGRFQRQAGEEIVFLQDGGIRQSDFAQQVQNAGTCRLKILITDRCNHICVSASGESQQRNNLLRGKELFQNHEGFLHLTSAATNEFGWAEENDGGLFTAALARAIGSEPDTHENRIVSWQKIFDETREATGKQFERARPMLPKATTEILRRQGIESQTPIAYALPTRIETRQAREPDPGPAPEELSDVTGENIVYVEHEGYMYLAQLTDPDNAGTEAVAVHIFNEELRGKLGQTLPAERVLDKRTEPEEGWGNRHIRLNFYRDGEWHLTFEGVVFETYYLLPEHIGGKRVQGPRKVRLDEVRIAIPVSYQESEPPTQKFYRRLQTQR